MTKSWYTIKSEIYEEINRNRSEKWKSNPSLIDYINKALKQNDDFSSEMRKELIILLWLKLFI